MRKIVVLGLALLAGNAWAGYGEAINECSIYNGSVKVFSGKCKTTGSFNVEGGYASLEFPQTFGEVTEYAKVNGKTNGEINGDAAVRMKSIKGQTCYALKSDLATVYCGKFRI